MYTIDAFTGRMLSFMEERVDRISTVTLLELFRYVNNPRMVRSHPVLTTTTMRRDISSVQVRDFFGNRPVFNFTIAQRDPTETDKRQRGAARQQQLGMNVLGAPQGRDPTPPTEWVLSNYSDTALKTRHCLLYTLPDGFATAAAALLVAACTAFVTSLRGA